MLENGKKECVNENWLKDIKLRLKKIVTRKSLQIANLNCFKLGQKSIQFLLVILLKKTYHNLKTKWMNANPPFYPFYQIKICCHTQNC